MRIVLNFDEAVLRDRAARGKNLVFVIYFENDGDCYPDDSWRDFGSVIIGWWASAVLHLLNGAGSEELLFMDGPPKVGLRYDRATDSVDMTLGSGSAPWETTISDLAEQIIGAANRVVGELRRLGVSHPDASNLSKLEPLLREALRSRYN